MAVYLQTTCPVCIYCWIHSLRCTVIQLLFDICGVIFAHVSNGKNNSLNIAVFNLFLAFLFRALLCDENTLCDARGVMQSDTVVAPMIHSIIIAIFHASIKLTATHSF
eukprot:589208_1